MIFYLYQNERDIKASEQMLPRGLTVDGVIYRFTERCIDAGTAVEAVELYLTRFCGRTGR